MELRCATYEVETTDLIKKETDIPLDLKRDLQTHC